MKVAILDDYFDTLRGLPCFAKLDGFDVTVFTDHVKDVPTLAARLAEFDALVLFRERTAISAELLDRLPRLKLISMRGVYPHVDVAACTRNGVVFCSNTKAAAPSHPAAELTWALILASMQQVPQQMTSLRAGDWQMGVGRSLSGRRLGVYGYGRLGKKVSEYGAAFGMDVRVWGSEAGRARALADGVQPAESREAFFAGSDIVSLHVRLTPETRGLERFSTDLNRWGIPTCRDF